MPFYYTKFRVHVIFNFTSLTIGNRGNIVIDLINTTWNQSNVRKRWPYNWLRAFVCVKVERISVQRTGCAYKTDNLIRTMTWPFTKVKIKKKLQYPIPIIWKTFRDTFSFVFTYKHLIFLIVPDISCPFIDLSEIFLNKLIRWGLA